MKLTIVAIWLFAILLGAMAALFGGLITAVLFVGLASVALVLWDYRVGVVLLTVLLPFSGSPLLPQVRGFNPVNYLVAAALFVLLLGRSFRRTPSVWPPKVFWLCFVLPMTFAVLVGVGHLSEARQYSWLANADTQFLPGEYLKLRLVRSLFFVIYAFLLANAVRDSKQPERFLLVFGIATLVPALAVVGTAAASGLSLSALQSRRGFLSNLGLHANEFGMLLALAIGPALYLMAHARGAARVAAGVSFATILAALLLTFSRGAYLAFVVVLLIFLYERRRIRTIVTAMVLGGIIVLAGPAAFRERMTAGADAATLAEAESGNKSDTLTAGRISIYYELVPELSHSPLWGRGAGATAWTDAVKAGRYRAGHPHSMYLEILLDVGLLGLVALLYLYRRYFVAMRALSRNSELPTSLRAYFSGAGASFVGMLVMAFTNGHWMPHPEQTFLWFAIGMTIAYWPKTDVAPDSAGVAGRRATGLSTAQRRGQIAWNPKRYR